MQQHTGFGLQGCLMFITALARADSRHRCRRRCRRRRSSSSSSTGDGQRRSSFGDAFGIGVRVGVADGVGFSAGVGFAAGVAAAAGVGVAAMAPPALWRAGRRVEGPDQDDGGESMRMRPCRDAPPRAQSEKPHNVEGKRYWLGLRALRKGVPQIDNNLSNNDCKIMQ